MNKFNLYKGGINNKFPNEEINILQLKDLIESNIYKEKIEDLRNTIVQEDIKEIKESLDYVTIAGTFTSRDNSNLISSSGYLIIDIDDDKSLETRKKLEDCEYTHLLFKSPRGGFKIIVKILNVKNDDEYKEYIESCWEEYSKITPVDKSGSDIARACFLSYDENVYYNPDSKIWIDKNKRKKISFLEIDSELINIFIPEWVKGKRQNLALYLSGVLRNKGFGTIAIKNLIKEIMQRAGDSDYKERLSTVESTFEQNIDNIKGYSGLKDNMSESGFRQFCNMIDIDIKIQTREFKLHHVNNHMPEFDLLNKSLGLYGNEYRIIKKSIMYHIIGNAIKTPEKYIKYKGIMFDTRVNLSLFMNSGAGKNEINRVCSNTLTGLQIASNVVSLHPEQLIGKTTVNKKTNTVNHNKGYFNDDELIIDEARYFFTQAQGTKESTFNELRKYFCIALNPMGQNKIVKRSVDQKRNEMLEYYPRCSVIMLTQPVTISKEVIESGFLRRFIVLNLKGQQNKKDIFTKRVYGEDKDPYVIELVNYLENVIENIENEAWSFDDINDDLINYASLLVEFGMNHSEKAAQYMNNIYAQTTLDLLLKFACIVAVFTRGEKNVTSQDVKIAYMDLFEIMSSMFETINTYAEDFYSYDISYIDLLVLRWLKKQQMKINVQTITQYINGLDGGHINTSVKRYQHLVRKGFLNVRHGKSEAEISLTDKSLELLKNENMINDNFYEEYYKICKEVNKQ